ncbi:MAG TPA: hypothetical protein VMZ29_05975 [Candidatus Bathyarchaeia archaeon]|nr:hypothetical protein [Candidatus Bathyarchaeia archaeon]
MRISELNSEGQLNIEKETSLEESLLRKSAFEFHLCFEQKKFKRNCILLIFFNTIIDASLGAILSFLLDFLGYTNEYAI